MKVGLRTGHLGAMHAFLWQCFRGCWFLPRQTCKACAWHACTLVNIIHAVVAHVPALSGWCADNYLARAMLNESTGARTLAGEVGRAVIADRWSVSCYVSLCSLYNGIK